MAVAKDEVGARISELGKGSKVKKEKKTKKISFRYVRVAENFEILVFFSFFFPTYFE